MKWCKTIILAVATATMLLPLSEANASPTDPMIEGAKLCTRHLPRFEREYAIPTHLLSAIATTESGRYHDGLGMKLPWPWAINAKGKGYWFESKEEAIAAVKKLRARGVQSIDVGCMQVNLYQHPEAFASLSEAFEPQTNIAYAANFLRALYDQGGTWKKAAGDYHSRTPSLGKEYVGQVYGSWYTIIDKLRTARLNVPESSVAALQEMKNPKRPAPVARTSSNTHTATPRVIHMASADTVKVVRPKLYEQENRQVAPFEHARMNTISISSDSDHQPVRDYRRSSNLIVVHNDSDTAAAPAVAPVAPTAPVAPAVATTVAPTAPAALPANVGASLAPAPAQTTAPEIKTADSTPLQTPLQTPVQRILVNPVTGSTADAQSLSDISPSAGRRTLEAQPSRRSGPNFIFND